MQEVLGPLDAGMAGESGSVTPLEHVGAEGGWNEQAVWGAGTGGWQIKGGGPYLLLNLPGDSSDKAGGWDNGGGFCRLIRGLGELSRKSIWFSVPRARAIGQGEIKPVEKQRPAGLSGV